MTSAPHPDSRICSDCPNPISRTSKGRCRPCGARFVSADREIVARRNAKTIATRRTPEVRARHSAACRVAAQRRLQNPVELARLQELGTRGALNFWRALPPEQQATARQAIRRAMLAWCPEEHWALNAALKRKSIPLAERTRIILELVPGTVEHARVQIKNHETAQQLRAAREKAQAY